MSVQHFTGRIETFVSQMRKEGTKFKSGIYKTDNNEASVEVRGNKNNFVYLGRPKAFPRNVEWKYYLGELDLSLTKEELKQAYVQADAAARVLRTALIRNQLPPHGVLKVHKPVTPLDFTETSIQSQIKTIAKLVNIPGYENTLIKYKDTSHNSQNLHLEVSSRGKASYILPYRLRKSDKSGKSAGWKSETKKVIGDARKITLEQARKYAATLKERYVDQNKPIPANLHLKDEAVTTFRELHEMQVRGLRGENLKPSTIAEYDKIAFNYLGTKQDYKEYKIVRQALNGGVSKNFAEKYVGIGILDRDFNTLSFEDAKEFHAQLTTLIEENQKESGKKSRGRQADKVFTYIRTLIDKGNLLKQESDNSWVMRNPILLFSKEKVWNNPGGNSIRKNNTLSEQHYPVMWLAVQELSSYRLEKSRPSDNRRNTNTDVLSYKLYALLYEFLLYTGFRPQDAVRIEWSQVDLKAGSITWNSDEQINIKNGKSINDEHFILYLNQQAFTVLKKIKSLHDELRSSKATPFNQKIVKAQAETPSDKTRIMLLEKERDETVAQLACNQFVFCNAYMRGKGDSNPSAFNDKLEELTGIRISAGMFRSMFQQKAAEVGLKDYEIKRLVFHKVDVNKYDVQAGYDVSSPEHLRRISQKVANKISSLCRAEFGQEAFMFIDSSLSKDILNAVDIEQDDDEIRSIEHMSDEEYSKYITLKQRTIEEHALLMVKDFLQMMKNPEARKLFEALNFYKDDRKYLLD